MAINFIGVCKRYETAMTVRPASAIDEEQMREIPEGREVKFLVSVPRNIKFHRKFFALLKVIFDMMSEDDRAGYGIINQDQLLIRLKLDLGLYDLWISHEGNVIYIPGSISFGKMDNSDFDRFYKDVINVAIGKYVPSQNEESMMQMVDAILRFE